MSKVLAWNHDRSALVATELADVRVIWSAHHQGFWRNRGAGYTHRLEYAGLYTADSTITRDKMLTIEEAWKRFSGPEQSERIEVDMLGSLLQRDRKAALCWHAVKRFFSIAEVADGDGTLAIFAENPDITKHLPEAVQEMQQALLVLGERSVDAEGDPIDPESLPTVEDVLAARGSYLVREQAPWLEAPTNG